MKIVDFFRKAFGDMKRSAKAQHDVDRAEFEAVKAESKANDARYSALENLRTKNPEGYRRNRGW